MPPGFAAERVATAPQVTHPMFACFDDQGRLYVATSSGEDLDAAARLKNPPDAIRCLEDTDGDGRFDKSTVFADKLTYPQGVLWHNGAIYTASPPGLWRLEDTDGDGQADRREELVTGFPFTGIADDLHGPSLGPDGRIYWCVGRFPYQIRRPRGPLIRQGTAPLIMRCRPDGEEVEVFSAAMGNPVEVAFNPSGEPFSCGTFLSPEAQGMGLRDAIIHCVEGGVYSVRDRTVIEEKQTGDRLPPLVQLGVAAGSGIMFDHAGSIAGGRPTLLAAMFNLHKVQRLAVDRDGASYRARIAEFLVSHDPDFHPTDVLQDADGSILVVDTGGWFRHCPTSQIEKPNVAGGIYRIRSIGWDPGEDPWGLQIAWDEADPLTLTRYLRDARPAVRQHAIAELARRGKAAVPALRDAVRIPSPRFATTRLNAVWALTRIDAPEARAALRPALFDPDPRVRLAATTSVGLHRDADALTRLVSLLRTPDLAVRRSAATALGRIAKTETVPRLLQALRTSKDRFLDHALIRALILIADFDATRKGLEDTSPRVRRGALIALSQMDGSKLTADMVTPLLDPAEPDLAQAAMHVIVSRPDWALQMIEPLRHRLAEEELDASQRDELQRALLTYCRVPDIQNLVASTLQAETTPAGSRVLLMEIMPRAPLTDLPRSWRDAVVAALRSSDPQVVRQAVLTIRALNLADADSQLFQIARDPSQPDELRLDAMAALARRMGSGLAPDFFDSLRKLLSQDQPPLVRLDAARTLGTATLDHHQLDRLLADLATADSLTLPRLLPAFARFPSQEIGSKLLAVLEHSSALPALSPELLRSTFAAFPEETRRAAEALALRIDSSSAEQAERLASLQTQLKSGNPLRGREVFFGSKVACSTCHTVLGEGGHVGPDLSRIGEGRTTRDLLEAILYPSASFARGYEPHLISTSDGHVYAGIIIRETADQLCLISADRTEVCIPRNAIDAIEPARTSIMPQGLETSLTPQELADLLAYLRSLQ